MAENMKHDFRKRPSGESADRFALWLEQETIESLRRSMGDGEAIKSAIFLFVIRAYEAHMTDDQVGGMFGKCFVRAGFPEQDEEAAYAWLEFFGQLAAKVHA
jgi:hypothetical protein